jgi:DNA polymerase-3 subunit delta'
MSGGEIMFDNIIGHEEIKKYFQAVIHEDNLCHAYIFTGANGIGKRTFALELAKQFCGIDRNIINVVPKDNNISVDDVREMQERISKFPYNYSAGKKYFIIINDAECLNEASSNSLLKILEEPPEYCVFILLTEDFINLPDTIISRCIVKKFNYISEKIINKMLTDLITDKKFLNFVSCAVSGRVGDVIKMKADSGIIEEYKSIYRLYSILNNETKKYNLSKITEMFELKDNQKLLKQLRCLKNYYAYQYYSGKEDAVSLKIACEIEHAEKLIKEGLSNMSLTVEVMTINIININKRRGIE